MNISQNMLTKNKNLKKLRHGYVDYYNKIISSCHWKTLAPFCLPKEKTWKHVFNTNSELSQNHTEKQIMPSKTTVNWLLNDTWCYLFIACFDWKISVFQKGVVRIYCILKMGIFNHFSLHSIKSELENKEKVNEQFQWSLMASVIWNNWHMDKICKSSKFPSKFPYLKHLQTTEPSFVASTVPLSNKLGETFCEGLK